MLSLKLKMLTITALLLGVAAISAAPLDDKATQVADIVHTVPGLGQLLGQQLPNGSGRTYFSFKGIPYALPPVGPLRFRNPKPFPGWTGIWNATEHRAECIQSTTLNTAVVGAEDCLYLNVYSPDLSGKRAVMVWIHGGGYDSGSGDSFLYGSDQLVAEDVVVVTINYRLSFLGFFSTGDRHASGNYGMKDAVEALKWVQSNIEHFGGDKNKVTIFGESAGSAMVHLMMLSPAARGLFSGVISESGVAASPWAFQRDPKSLALDLARRMNLVSTTTEGIVEELRQITNYTRFMREVKTVLTLPTPRGHYPFEFSPCVESEWDEPPFLTQSPMEVLRSGRWNQVPWIVGSNSHEALYNIREIIIDPTILEKWQANPWYVIPTHWKVDRNSDEANEIVASLQNLYFNGTTVQDRLAYAVFNSDTHFHYPVRILFLRIFFLTLHPSSHCRHTKLLR